MVGRSAPGGRGPFRSNFSGAALAESRIRPATADIRVTRVRADAANVPGWLALFGFILLILLPSDVLLSHGFIYNRPGGSPLMKLHPSTYVFLASFVAWLARGNPLARLATLARDKPGIAAYGAALAILIVEQLFIQGASGTAFIVDTLLVPWFIVLALDESPLTFRRTFFYVVVGILFFNSLVAIGESIVEGRIVHLFGVDREEQWTEFRASAWLDHPLSNALVTSSGLFAVFVMRDRPLLLSILVLAMALSLLSFGGRTAFAVTLAVGLVCSGVAAWRSLASGRLQYRTLLTWAAVAMAIPLIALVSIMGLDLGERLFAAWRWDDSAESRLLAFRVFDVVSFQDLLFGISPAEIQAIVDNYLSFYTSLTIIENVWIVWILQFGLVLFVIVAASLAVMIWSILRGAPWPLWVAAFVFIVVGSGNNSLATKTFLLSMLVALLMGGRAYAELAKQGRRTARAPRPRTVVRHPSATLLTGPRRRGTLLRSPPSIGQGHERPGAARHPDRISPSPPPPKPHETDG